MKITMPKGVTAILNKLSENGHEAYIVGGCVRDMLLNRTPGDWDITTSAVPEEVKALFSRTIDTGIKHGTITVRLFDTNWEVTTFRADGAYEDFRHPKEVFFTDNISEDLKRRDFTMNAIAYNPETGFIDEHEGISDIENKIIRGVGNPNERFLEDALRMLRALRFSAQLDFRIEKETYDAIKNNASLISHVSAERIKEELDKLISSDFPELMSKLWDTEILKYISKPLFDLKKDMSSDLKSLPNKKALRWAYLFKDAQNIKDELKNLRFDNKSITLISFLCANKDTPIYEDKYYIRKKLSEWGEEKFRLLTDFRYKEDFSKSIALLDEILKDGDCITLKQLAVNGGDLIKSGIPKGEALGAVLNFLLDEVHKNPGLNKKEILLDMSKKFN